MYEIDINAVISTLPYIIKGLKITILISITSSCIAFVIGIITAFFRFSDNLPMKSLSAIYVEFIRNTPLLVQLYIFYKGLPNIGVDLSPLVCGILALSIYTGAFISEVLRSGINSITQEQHEAAKGLGLSELQVFLFIIFPQAIRIIIPPLGSQFINLIKNSSLVSFIAVSDLFYIIYKEAVNNFRFLEFFIVGAIIYMILTGIVALITNLIEHQLKIPGRMVKV